MDAQQTVLFQNVIAASIDLARSNMELSAKDSPEFSWAVKQINTRQARIRLVIEFNPAPSVTCELIREDDGESLGFLFQLSARSGPVEN